MKSVKHHVGEVPSSVYESCLQCETTFSHIISELQGAGDDIYFLIRENLEEGEERK